MAFSKKQPQQAALKIGQYGPAGSGKTFTALLCAEGLAAASQKRIAFIDTERGGDFYAMQVDQRTVHPEPFDFDALETRSITESIEAVRSLDVSTYGVLIVDSISHIWDATMNAWPGEGEVPPWAWSKIKKPYREFMHLLIASPAHVIVCGREGNKYDNDEVVGKKLRGEAESDYEPHLMLRLAPVQTDAGCTYRAIVEKDRTGMLSGRTIEAPDFDKICKPLMGLLGATQAPIMSDNEVASQDAAALSEEESLRAQTSTTHKFALQGTMLLAENMKQLDAISKSIPKRDMSAKDIAELRVTYKECCDRIKGSG